METLPQTPLVPPTTPATLTHEEPSLIVPPPLFKVPSAKQQSWGTIISILIIVGMITLGAFYAWGKRIAQTHNLSNETDTSTATY